MNKEIILENLNTLRERGVRETVIVPYGHYGKHYG